MFRLDGGSEYAELPSTSWTVFIQCSFATGQCNSHAKLTNHYCCYPYTFSHYRITTRYRIWEQEADSYCPRYKSYSVRSVRPTALYPYHKITSLGPIINWLSLNQCVRGSNPGRLWDFLHPPTLWGACSLLYIGHPLPFPGLK